MANQPKPPPKPEPKPTPKPGPAAGPERDPGDERDRPGPDHDRGRDKTGNIPGTPYTPPEGHDHREPGPGEPGGPSGGALDRGAPTPPPVRTIADEQRERAEEVMKAGVEGWKAERDERTDEERAGNRQVPGVAPPAPEEGRVSHPGASR
jgi:translation initiation factor IF-2